MTTNTLKAFRKISTVLVTSATLILPTVTASNAGGNGSEPTIVDGGHMLSVCFLDGGQVVTEANGDNFCWNPVTDKTTECSGPNGSPDACWTEGRPTGGKPNKPVRVNSGGTMVMPPDTNTTVDSGMNPLNGKLIMRSVIRN